MSRLLLLVGTALLAAVAARAAEPIILSPEAAAHEGRALVDQILSERPAQNMTNTGVLRIRYSRSQRVEKPVRFEISATASNWSSIYEVGLGTDKVSLAVIHSDSKPNEYRLTEDGVITNLSQNATMIPFAGSDFWVADLGLEFFHWPKQSLLRKEIRRGQSCNVLESVNPHPAPGAYSRVVSWIDIDTDGIVFAEAYDAQGKLLKQFAPKSFKKVRGEWQLEEMEMDNRQTGSRTWIEFNVGENK